MLIRESVEIGGTELSIETGRMAKQADGAVIVRYGDTMVLVTAVADSDVRDTDFLPLTVDYTEKMYAAGRIPGSYFRREGRPSVPEVLVCRMIDRPIRPALPQGLAQRDPDHRHRALIGQGEPGGRAGAHRRLRGADHLGHPLGRPAGRHPRGSRRRRVRSPTRPIEQQKDGRHEHRGRLQPATPW